MTSWLMPMNILMLSLSYRLHVSYFNLFLVLTLLVTSENATVVNLGYENVNLGSKFDFVFSLQQPLDAGDSIKFNFPVGFYFLNPACFHRNSGTYTSVEVLHNQRMVICQSFSHPMAANVSQTVSIVGVVNPEYSGYFQKFFLETMKDVTAHVYEKITVPNPIHILPGSIIVDVKSASNLMALNTTHQVDMIFEDDVKSDEEVWIILPSGFRYKDANCTLLRSLEPATPNGKILFITTGI